MLESDRATLQAREGRIADLEAKVEEYRWQLATVITRAIAKNQALVERKPRRAARAKAKVSARRRGVRKRPGRKPKSKRRAKR